MQRKCFAEFVLLLAGLVAGCAERPEGARAPKGGPGLGAPTVAWRHKTHEERMAFMGAHVAPEMKKLFVKFDSDYENFDCQTCHGSDMDLIDYKMPNALYPLPAEDPIKEAMDLDEDTAQFMMSEVVPKMAELLSEKPGARGVNCFTCHPKE